jgi:excisionase family DNA binding protein
MHSASSSASEVRRPSLEKLPSVMTADSVSRALRVNRKTIYEMVKANSIPGVVRVGRVIRFSRDALLAWLGVKPGAAK